MKVVHWLQAQQTAHLLVAVYVTVDAGIHVRAVLDAPELVLILAVPTDARINVLVVMVLVQQPVQMTALQDAKMVVLAAVKANV